MLFGPLPPSDLPHVGAFASLFLWMVYSGISVDEMEMGWSLASKKNVFTFLSSKP